MTTAAGMLPRRSVLLGAGAAALAPIAAAKAADNGTGSGATGGNTGSFAREIAGQLAKIPEGPALLASYPAPVGHGVPADFTTTNRDVAYTYDNALAGLALIAAGHVDQAARIGSALLLAQEQDPDGADGRLRNAYRAGAIGTTIALPGWWDRTQHRWDEDPYQVGSDTGPLAWAILLFAALADARVAPVRYRRAARRIAAWLVDKCRGSDGFTGGLYGYRPHQTRLDWTSTEQNVDCAVAFRRLAMPGAANHAAGFVRSMRDPKTGLYAAGLGPKGKRNDMLAADACLWPALAGLGPDEGVLPTIEALGHPREDPRGIGYSEASQGIWLEGTAFAAIALRRAGDSQRAARFLATLRTSRTKSGYVLATTAPRLATGLTTGPGASSPAVTYYPVPALAPTAWAALAAARSNPLAKKS